jgi:hypothetical protein
MVIDIGQTMPRGSRILAQGRPRPNCRPSSTHTRAQHAQHLRDAVESVRCVGRGLPGPGVSAAVQLRRTPHETEAKHRPKGSRDHPPGCWAATPRSWSRRSSPALRAGVSQGAARFLSAHGTNISRSVRVRHGFFVSSVFETLAAGLVSDLLHLNAGRSGAGRARCWAVGQNWRLLLTWALYSTTGRSVRTARPGRGGPAVCRRAGPAPGCRAARGRRP